MCLLPVAEMMEPDLQVSPEDLQHMTIRQMTSANFTNVNAIGIYSLVSCATLSIDCSHKQ